MIKRLIPETTVYIGDGLDSETGTAATKTIMETDVVPWLGSFNNVSFIDSENNYYYYDIGSDTIIMFFYWHNDRNFGGASIGLCRKDFREIKIVTATIKDKNIVALSDKWMVSNFELHAIADNDNNLVTLFIDGTANLPASGCNYIFFDVDNFGEKYIGFRENAADYSARRIIYLNDKRSILHRYYPNSNGFSYSNEDYVTIEKAEIFNSINNQFVSLSTNMVRIINNFLNTDKTTNFTVIEINGVKYRKLEYDIWIKDEDN